MTPVMSGLYMSTAPWKIHQGPAEAQLETGGRFPLSSDSSGERRVFILGEQLLREFSVGGLYLFWKLYISIKCQLYFLIKLAV